jgi:6-pyruvoyltetrahydropterin/6-carboxytetrahydropterin synthase
MLTISKRFTFEASHRLRFHEGACRNLHGHSYALTVYVQGPRKVSGPATGMVVDFKRLKQAVEGVLFRGQLYEGDRLIDTTPFDHAVMLHEDDELCALLRDKPLDADGHGLRVIPMTEEPTAEYMAGLFAGLVQKNLDGLNTDVEVVRIDLYETETSRATWEADDPYCYEDEDEDLDEALAGQPTHKLLKVARRMLEHARDNRLNDDDTNEAFATIIDMILDLEDSIDQQDAEDAAKCEDRSADSEAGPAREDTEPND